MTTPATQPTAAEVWAALQDVKDPEIPSISVVEMGIAHHVIIDGTDVTIEATPTFVGCPALKQIESAMQTRVGLLPAVGRVKVNWVMDPPWTTDRITPEGREKLREFGISPPSRPGLPADGAEQPIAFGRLPLQGSLFVAEIAECPFCGSQDTELENIFGPTACRSLYYCKSCRNPFERLKDV